MDRLFIGPYNITAVSQYVWAQVGGRARSMEFLQALYFFFSPCLGLRAKCRVCIAWLIKRLICRLAWNVRAQRGRNMTQLYMQLDATIDDITATANQWRHRLWRRVASSFPPTPIPVGAKAKCSFILCEKFTVGYSSQVTNCLLLVNCDRFSSCKCCTTP